MASPAQLGSWGQGLGSAGVDLGGFEGHAAAAAARSPSPDARASGGETPPTQPLRVSSRATGVAGGVPPSANLHALFVLAEDFRVPTQLVAKLLKALAADDDTTMEDFGMLTSAEFEAAIDIMTDATGTECTSLERSKLRRLHLRAGHVARAPPPPPVVPVAPVPKVVKPKKRKFEEVIEQGAGDATFEVMSKEATAKVRDTYETVAGAEPPDNFRPTREQLSGLKDRIDEGDAPFADFAVFGNFGRKAAKLRRFEIQVMVGDKLHTRLIQGPDSHSAWMDSWQVYSTALIALGAVSQGSLTLYQEGIRRLTVLYPHSWGEILIAEEEMRFEHWDRMQEELVREPLPKYLSTRPWDFIVSQSAYSLGKANMCTGWWKEHLTAGLNSTQRTQTVVSGLLGRSDRGSVLAPGQASSSTSPPPVAPPKGAGRNPTPKTCDKFNAGNCGAPDGPCPKGYAHQCAHCKSKSHAKLDCPQGGAKRSTNGQLGGPTKHPKKKGGHRH